MLSQNYQTCHVGRLMVDLPKAWRSVLNLNDKVSDAPDSLSLNGFRIATKSHVSLEEFQRIVDQRWDEVRTLTHDAYGNRYTRLAEYHQVRENGGYFAYEHEMISYSVQAEDGAEVLESVQINRAEGYFWDRGTLFTIKKSVTYASINKDITDLLLQLSYRENSAIPEQAGICLYGGFVAQPYQGKYEAYYFGSGEPYLSFGIRCSDELSEQTLLQQDPDPDSLFEELGEKIIRSKAYRANKRLDGHLPAEEVVEGMTESFSAGYADEISHYTTTVSAVWEFGGQRSAVLNQPKVRAELVLTVEHDDRAEELGAYPEPFGDDDWPTEKAFFEMWDSIVSSIRFYPGALDVPPQPSKPVLHGPSDAQRVRNRQALDDFLGGAPHLSDGDLKG